MNVNFVIYEFIVKKDEKKKKDLWVDIVFLFKRRKNVVVNVVLSDEEFFLRK